MQPAYQSEPINSNATSSWRARLELDFAATEHGSILCKNLHHGPLMVQKPLYPESKKVCHVYLLHPPGGVVHGDQLSLRVNLQPQAHALLTTPGAGKFYRSQGQTAVLDQQINVDDDARLEWMPQETILFDQSQVQLKTMIQLHKRARFIGWEMLCLGRKASQAPYLQGQCNQHFEIWRDSIPLYIERSHLAGGSPRLQQKWGMDHHPLTATFIATHCGSSELKAVQALLEAYNNHTENPILVSASLKQDVLIARFLGSQAEHARKVFTEIWKLIRPIVMERKVQVPRIWNT